MILHGCQLSLSHILLFMNPHTVPSSFVGCSCYYGSWPEMQDKILNEKKLTTLHEIFQNFNARFSRSIKINLKQINIHCLSIPD